MMRLARSGAAALLALAALSGPLAGNGRTPIGTPAALADGLAAEARSGSVLERAGRDLLADAGRIWSSPFHIKKRDVVPLVALAVATGFLIAVDEDLRDAVKGFSDGHEWVQDIGHAVTQMGGWGAAAAAGVFYGAGLLFHDPRARDTGVLAGSVIVQTFLVDFFLKGMSGRQRPFYEDGVDHWTGPAAFFGRFDADNEGRYDSFPSGHTATAFGVATVVALQYRHRPWVPVLAYTIASGVALSRMTEDRHWASDVLVGAVIGHLIARLVVRSHRQRHGIAPVIGFSRRSVTIGFNYLGPAGP